MKQVLILIWAIMLTIVAYGQKVETSKVPAAIIKTFKVKFPKADKVKWEMENKKDYEASFKTGTAEQTATFTPEGKWIETETEIEASQLPETVQQAIAKQFEGYKIKEASKVENEKWKSFYEVEVVKGNEIIEIAISSTGEVLSKKVERIKVKESQD
jgi:hypothetical protein